MHGYRYVILGGGMVGGYAAKELARRGLAAGEMCILSADNAVPCERPPLSKKFLAGEKDEQAVYINEPEFYRRHGIELRLNTVVTQVDLARRRLRTAAGDEVAFERLLIATGTRVRKLDVPGAELPGVFYLRWLDDSRRIRSAYAGARRAVVVGGGYIGMEVAAVLAGKGIEVTMVYPGEHLLERVFTPEMAEYFEETYRRHGVRLLSRRRIAAFEGTDRAARAVTDDGQRLEADLVVAGIGVEPVTDILQDTGLRIDDGVVVDEHLRTGVPDVWAAGDVARFPDLQSGKLRRLEHWDNAVNQGEYMGAAMAGAQAEPYRHLSYFFSDEFELSWELWGDRRQAEHVVYRGDLRSGAFSAWWLAQGRLVCAFVMNRPDEERELAQKWIREGTRVTAEVLQHGG